MPQALLIDLFDEFLSAAVVIVANNDEMPLELP